MPVYSSYNDLVQSFSPSYYLKLDETNYPLANTGSVSATLNTTASYTYYTPNQTGIVNKCVSASSGTHNSGMVYTTDTTSIFNSNFTFGGWFKFNNTSGSGGTVFRINNGLTGANEKNFHLQFYTNNNNIGAYAAKSESNGGSTTVTSTLLSGTGTTNTWHYIAVVFEPGSNSVKFYIDGVLKTSNGSFDGMPTGISAFNKGFLGSAFTKTNYQNFSDGYADELAVFPSALTAQNLLDLSSWPYGAYPVSTPLTSSALFVNPTVSAIRNVNYSNGALTATALMGNAAASNFNPVQSLTSYLTSLNADEYLKMDSVAMLNSGTLATDSYYTNGTVTPEPNTGPQSVPALKFTSGGQIQTQPPQFYGNAAVASLFNSADVGFGVWTKFDGSVADYTVMQVFHLDSSFAQTNAYSISIDSGVPTFTITLDDTTTISVDGSTLSSNQWHFLAGTFDGGTLEFFVNGVSVGTATTTGTVTTANSIQFGGNPGSGTTYVASFVASPLAEIDEAELDQIYALGSVINQAAAFMPEPLIRISTAFYDKAEALDAIYDFRMDNAGLPNNFGTGTADIALYGTPEDMVSGFPGKLIGSYKSLSTNTTFSGTYSTPSGTFSTNDTQSIVAVVKADPANFGTLDGPYGPLRQFIQLGGGDSGGSFGNGLILGFRDDAYFVYTTTDGFSTEYFLNSNTPLDDQWHLLAATFDGTDLKLYVDGKLDNSVTTSGVSISDSGHFELLGGECSFWVIPTDDTVKQLDTVAVFNTELSAQDIFEFWQLLTIDGAMTASASLPLPVGLTGYGPTINPGVSYASAALPDPTQQDTVAPTILPMTAFGAFANPNYAATKTVTISATALTASAQAENAMTSVGEFNAADHMSASAMMPEAYVRLPGRWNAAPMIANPATMVDPATTFTRGGLWNAPALTAKAQFVLPPAYKSLQDDLWYRELFLQHSQTHGSIGYTAGVSDAYAFLKLFDDVTSDLNGSNTSKITNNLPWRIVIDQPQNTESRTTYATAYNEFTTAENTPVLETGYYDEFQRKAVRFNNISFKIDEDSRSAIGSYSVEMTIKTTKADQILMSGVWYSQQSAAQSRTSLGLVDGKLYGLTSPITQTLHPKNPGLNTVRGSLTGRKRIDDGNWHHIVIQYGYDNRTQFWVDGELDIQAFSDRYNYGLNVRPYIIGYNSKDDAFQSDFFTSTYSYDAQYFTPQQDIILHNAASFNYEPIKAEPMANAVATMVEPKVSGNRGRALMLYWWPTSTGQATNQVTNKFDKNYNTFDKPTFDSSLQTVDYVENPPQVYFGWDVFPVDITGYYVSDLVKEEAYGGAENIEVGPFGGQNIYGGNTYLEKVKTNRRGSFRDPITDDRRYIDLVNDIDLSKFDAIFFKNFPDQSVEIDEFANNQVVDSYFNLRELKIYEDFIKSVRAAVDTGLSLYVTNTELAIDLGIIDRVEVVPDMDDLASGYDSDVYAPTLAPGDPSLYPVTDGTTANRWYDTYKNNRQRLVNEIEGMTEFPTTLWTDSILWVNDDQIKWGGPSKAYQHYEIKPNGLSVGDEWIMSDISLTEKRNYQAVPFANVKAGTIVTAFANQVRRDLELIDNPYKNYATSIAVLPGDTLNGTQCGGKIFVNFTERLDGDRTEFYVDLIQDEWINYYYEEGGITSARRDQLLASPDNIDRKLAAGSITQQEYDELAFWSNNGDYILQQNNPIPDDSDTAGKGGIARETKSSVRKINKNNQISFRSVGSGLQFFSVSYSWKYPKAAFDFHSMLTRGFWWLSNRETPEGTVIRVTAMTASAAAGNALATPDVIVTRNATAMVAAAKINEAIGYSRNSVNNVSLPMEATAYMNDRGLSLGITTFAASARMGDNVRVLTSSIDEVIVYIMHEDPILYLREEVIK